MTGNNGQGSLVSELRTRVASALGERVRAEEVSEGRPVPLGRRRELVEELVEAALEHRARQDLAAGRAVLGAADESAVVRDVIDAFFGMAGLQPLLNDPQIENINVNGFDRVFVRYADGRRAQMPPVADSDEGLVELIRSMAARAGTEERRFDRANPLLNLQLPDGSRLFAAMAVTPRPVLSIRRHRFLTVSLDQLRAMGVVDAALASFLAAAVRARLNILISGGVSMGKTTALRALASVIPPHERLVTVEDAYELGLDRDTQGHPDVVPMQAREPNVEGEGEITQAHLVRSALRMAPDRVIVGEIRGPEVIPVCNAMSQGNDGSMATIHASASRGVFAKLAAYAIQGPERLPVEATALLVASAVHLIVHLAWSTDGRRVVSSIREVIDAEGPQVISNEVFRPRPDRRAIHGVPLRTETLAQLEAHGFDQGLLRHPGWEE